MNADEMSAGRELDSLVAEKVMGFTVYQSFLDLAAAMPVFPALVWHEEHWNIVYGDGNAWKTWEPSTDIAAAWQVVEHFGVIEIFHTFEHSPWLVRIPVDVYYNGEADTTPLAICRAALKAVKAIAT